MQNLLLFSRGKCLGFCENQVLSAGCAWLCMAFAQESQAALAVNGVRGEDLGCRSSSAHRVRRWHSSRAAGKGLILPRSSMCSRTKRPWVSRDRRGVPVVSQRCPRAQVFVLWGQAGGTHSSLREMLGCRWVSGSPALLMLWCASHTVPAV